MACGGQDRRSRTKPSPPLIVMVHRTKLMHTAFLSVSSTQTIIYTIKVHFCIFRSFFFFSKYLISMQFLLLFLFLALNFGFVFSKNEYLSTECIIGNNQFYHLKPIEPQTSNERKRNHHRENKMKCVQMNTHTHTHSEKCYIRTECRLFFYTKRYANEKRVLSTVYLLAKDTA